MLVNQLHIMTMIVLFTIVIVVYMVFEQFFQVIGELRGMIWKTDQVVTLEKYQFQILKSLWFSCAKL